MHGTRSLAAAHRHYDVRPFDVVLLDSAWPTIGQVDAKLSHHLDDFGMHLVLGAGAG
jgi:hypothetical protein